MNSIGRVVAHLALGLCLAASGRAQVVAEALSGAVDVAPAASDTWRRLAEGETLPEGARLRTGANGRARLHQGTRRLDVRPRGTIRWSGPDALRVEAGRVRIEQPRAAPPLRIEGRHSSGEVGSGVVSLRADAEQDLWRAHEGTLSLRHPGSGKAVQIPAGRQLAGDASGLGRPEAIPLRAVRREEARRSRATVKGAVEGSRREDLRWHDTLDKLLTASRRLVRRAEEKAVAPDDEVYEQMDQLGLALETARDEIEAQAEERALGNTPSSRASLELADRARRAVASHEALLARLDQVREPGPLGGRQAVGLAPTDASPTGRPDSRVALAKIQEALRFLRRYQQALRRFLRILARAIQARKPLLALQEARRIRGRLVGGYRQAERLVLAARAEAQRVPREERPPQVDQRLRILDRQWRAVGVQFRRAQAILRQIRAAAGAGP